MATLIEFLTARLDEDEAVALAAKEDSSVDGEYLPWRLSGDMGTELYAGHVALTSGPYGGMDEGVAQHLLAHNPARVLREVTAKRAIIERESIVSLPEWQPDCGGDWVLSGPLFFANYWPDNTVTASIGEDDGPRLADSGIVSKESRAACQAFAEEWIREHLRECSPSLRHLAVVYSDHAAYRTEWRP